MNLQELYSISVGQTISKPHISEKYYPLPFNNYITIQPWSKPVKNYDYYVEVLSLLNPILEKNNIKIIQLGAANEPALPFCHQTQGTTNFGQLAYLIKNSKLHFGADSIGQHLAGHFDIPLVDLVVNNYKKVVQPYFGNKDKQIILEPIRPEGHKPNFVLDGENPKSINSVCPIKIVESVLSLLNIPYKSEYKTLQIGCNYNSKIIEMLPDNAINIQNLNLNNIIIRMDYLFNEQVLFQQLNICKCTILTDKPINPQLLTAAKNQITEIIYNIKSAPDINFLKTLMNLKIPFRMISYLPDEILNTYKLDLLDIPGFIIKQSANMPQNFDINNINKYAVKSSKLLLARGKIFPSYYHFNLGQDIPSFDCPPMNLTDNNNLNQFFLDSDWLYYLEKIS